LLSSSTLKAQLTANFTVNNTGGCSPLAVTFSNSTTGASPSATYTWTFGNGNGVGPTSFSPTVSAVYSTPQSYTATLTVTDGGVSSSKSVTIIVYPKPTVSFTYSNAQGCLPLSTTFTSTSTAGAGTITNYFWDFGDGNTNSTTQSQVSNVYDFAQTYSPGLTVTNNFGCTSSLTLNNVVNVYPPVSANFTADSTTVCNASDPVQFNNTTTGPGTLTYLWNFGDGTTSTAANPSHTFTGKGIYTVTLVATSSDGCSSTTVRNKFINVSDFNPAFSLPAITCSNTPALFTDQSTPPGSGAPQWTFSDGGTASGTTAAHDFAAPGNYSVTLTETYGSCLEKLSKTVTVKAGIKPLGFVMQLDSVCGAPALVTFKDTTSAGAKWVWNFTGNPGDTSTAKNPTFTYPANGTMTPSLTVTDTDGCVGTVSQPLTIAPPTATITAIQTPLASDSVCAIINVLLSAVSADTLVQYLWNFGDGTTSTLPNPSHSYSTPGTYAITLSFITNHGCRGVSNSIPIVVYPKPYAAFVAPDTLICGNTPVQFNNQSTGNASVYTWNFGDAGGFQEIDGNPVYHSYGDSGTYTVTLIASNPGCADTAIRVNYIKVLPPFPNIKTLNTCDSTRGTVTIIDSATQATQSTWNFGDGSAIVPFTTSSDTAYHNYTHSGMYKVVLTCTNGACTLTDTATVYVLLKQQPQLSSTLTTICAGTALPVQITGLDTNYQSVATGNGTYYNINTWQYADSTTLSGSTSSLKTQYTGNVNGLKTGEDSIRTILKSSYFGCYDTSNYIPLKITGPIPRFTVTTPSCYKSPVIFTDSSQAVDSVPIVKWQWNFGDTSINSIRTAADTVMHIYGNPGTYTPQLTVTDSMGCSATTSVSYKNIIVGGTKANFYWTPPIITPGTTATFFNSSTGSSGAVYQWYFQSDGSTSSNPVSVTHTYTTVMVDSVRLIVSGSGGTGCVDTIVKAVPIENLNANFTYTSTYINSTNCPPMVAYFISTTFNADSLHWDFGDGATAEINPTPTHTYLLPGIYVVTLTAYGSNNTNIVTRDTLTVKGPFAKLTVSPVVGCIPAAVTLTAATSYASAYTWDFGDGTVLSSNDTTLTHTYTTPGVYAPALILTDSTGCQATFNPQSPVIMDTLHAQLGPNLQFCDSSKIMFNPSIVSFAADSLHQALTYHWTFGTGNPADTAATAQPGFDFTQAGVYPVQVQVGSIPGCAVTAFDTVTIMASARGTITGPFTACAGDSLQYTATPSTTGNISWSWSFGGTDTSSAQQPPLQSFPAGQDTVRLVLELNGCYDTTLHPLTVNPYPVLGLTPRHATICMGDSVQLNVNPGPAYTWTPPLGLSSDTSDAPKASPPLPLVYVVTGVENGCSRSDSTAITVIPRIILSMPADTFVCRGNSVQLTAGGADTYQWYPTGSLSNINNGTALSTPDTSTLYTVVGKDKYSCFADTTTIQVTVDPIPTVALPGGISTPAGVGVTLRPDASGDVVSYLWTPPDGLSCVDCANPQAYPTGQTTYTVTVATAYGCSATANVTIALTCREDAVSVPSAFTPNHDGHNDIFYPLGKGIKTINNFQVYDRWGRPVYSRQDIPINAESYGWDGTSNGREMPPDAYVYILQVTCDTGEKFMLKGTVVLIR